MLLAYIDEIGATGAFVNHDHEKYSDSPAFGYGGFIIPVENARVFSSAFSNTKKDFFAEEIPPDVDPGQWEKKGSDLLYALVHKERRQNLRILGGLIWKLKHLDGKLFYYAAEKPIGTPRQTNCGPEEFSQREETAMRETLNRLARYADSQDDFIMVMMDQINEKSRVQRLPKMYAHILGRAAEHNEMRKIVEPPMHIDSKLSANIQFADWICALTKRAIDYQLLKDSRYGWISEAPELEVAKSIFTYESKLHLYERSIEDINNSCIMYRKRPVVDTVLQQRSNAEKLERVRRATLREKQMQKHI